MLCQVPLCLLALDGREKKLVFHAHVPRRPRVITVASNLLLDERRRFDRSVTVISQAVLRVSTSERLGV